MIYAYLTNFLPISKFLAQVHQHTTTNQAHLSCETFTLTKCLVELTHLFRWVKFVVKSSC